MENYFSKIATWYFSRGALPYWCVLALDILITFVSLVWGYCLVSAFDVNPHNGGELSLSFLIIVFCFVIGYRVFHTYDGIIRYSSFSDLTRIVYALSFGCVLAVTVQSVLNSYGHPFPVMAIVIGTIFSILLMWLVRVIVKQLYDGILTGRKRKEKIFIYGVQTGGIAVAKSIRSRADCPYMIAGFISDKAATSTKRLMGKKIYYNDSSLVGEMKKLHVTSMLVSPLKNDQIRRNTEMVNALIEAGIKIRMVPRELEWDGQSGFDYASLHEVDVEALLPRDKIEVDMKAIGNLLHKKRILITGAAGSIGSEMVRQIAGFHPSELVLIDQAETPLHDIRLLIAKCWPDVMAHTIVGDIANKRRMEEIFSLYRPEYVFHAAAYKHVPMMEDNPAESVENNVNGTRIIADLSVKFGVRKFVMISTDKAVNPTNVMGCSKRICEIYVQALDKAIKEGRVKGVTQFVTTRFGNVLGSNGSVIPLFEKQIKEGGPVTVTHPDIIRFFMLIPEACKLVLEAGTMGHGGEIFVFDMGQPVKIADLARRMIKMSGAKDIEIRYTGLRDGEKLYEEVLNDQEVTLPTFHEKINIAKVREYDYDKVNVLISHLIDLAVNADDMTIVRHMKAIVPEFISQHSKYEVLDNKRSMAVRAGGIIAG